MALTEISLSQTLHFGQFHFYSRQVCGKRLANWTPITDYSNPKRIFCAIAFLAMWLLALNTELTPYWLLFAANSHSLYCFTSIVKFYAFLCASFTPFYCFLYIVTSRRFILHFFLRSLCHRQSYCHSSPIGGVYNLFAVTDHSLFLWITAASEFKVFYFLN